MMFKNHYFYIVVCTWCSKFIVIRGLLYMMFKIIIFYMVVCIRCLQIILFTWFFSLTLKKLFFCNVFLYLMFKNHYFWIWLLHLMFKNHYFLCSFCIWCSKIMIFYIVVLGVDPSTCLYRVIPRYTCKCSVLASFESNFSLFLKRFFDHQL